MWWIGFSEMTMIVMCFNDGWLVHQEGTWWWWMGVSEDILCEVVLVEEDSDE